MDSSPSESANLVADLLKQAESEKRKWKVRQLIAVLLSVNYAASVLLKDNVPEAYRRSYQYASLILFYFVASTMVGILGQPTRGQKKMLDRIANCSDRAVIGSLVDAHKMLRSQGHSASGLLRMVGDSLAQRLPGVREEDASHWTGTQRAALRDMLRTSTSVSILARDVRALRDRSMRVLNIRIALAALSAIEHIGGREDLNAVALLAYAEANDPDACAVRAAAQQCMIALEARVDRLQKSETLLRSCASSDSALLRASSGSVSEAQPRLLLHPSNSDASSTEAHHS